MRKIIQGIRSVQSVLAFRMTVISSERFRCKRISVTENATGPGELKYWQTKDYKQLIIFGLEWRNLQC